MSSEGIKDSGDTSLPTSITIDGHDKTPDVCELPKVRIRNTNINKEEITPEPLHNSVTGSDGFENSAIFIQKPGNEIEAHRISNNYLFGFKKWKSRVTSRPLSSRSEIVQDLYNDGDVEKYKAKQVSTIYPSNVLYAVFIGWWIALLYIIIAGLMLITIIGKPYAFFCWKLAQYFFWPFGKFVHQLHPIPLFAAAQVSYEYNPEEGKVEPSERTKLLGVNDVKSSSEDIPVKDSYWRLPQTYVWLVLGVPILVIAHSLICFFTWLPVVTIPTAKVNLKALRKLLFLHPEEVIVNSSAVVDVDSGRLHSEIILYTHQSINIYYYKFTIDGVNVILVNLLIFVFLSIALGYSDADNKITDGVTKCILAVLAIIPLTYYIGLSITSISAQSSFAVGAILNATFGSIVELILFVIVLKKGVETDKQCYQELVKSSLAGTILASILFIPGVCMIVGGIKYRTQNFNPRSASVSASLLFVSIIGVFTPTLYGKIYGDMRCGRCEINNSTTNFTNVNESLKCYDCYQTKPGINGDMPLYQKHIEPLIYACAIVLPLSYLVGLVFTLKTHSSHIYDAFNEQLKASSTIHEEALWSRLKSTIILLLCAILIALCADLVTDNLQPLLESTGVSEYFVGVTMLALVPELPEVVNGVQFALQNNVNLGIEIGGSTAIQVCLVQVPLLVLIDLIYPLNFILIFGDVHMYAVIFSVIVINYIFQDGKSDYFQGFIVFLIYLVIMSMYFFTITPENAEC